MLSLFLMRKIKFYYFNKTFLTTVLFFFCNFLQEISTFRKIEINFQLIGPEILTQIYLFVESFYEFG